MSYENTVFTYSYLFTCARRYLDIARYSQANGEPTRETGRPKLIQEDDPIEKGEWTLLGGSMFDAMACLTFCALTIEAAVNHIGDELVRHWTLIEPKLKTKEKLELLGDVSGHKIDFGAMPFTDFAWIQRVRNALAHGRTETIARPDATSSEEVEPDWMKRCTCEEAARAVSSTRAMVEQLFSNMLKNEAPFFLLSQGIGNTFG